MNETKKIVLFITACFSLFLCVYGINEEEVLGGFQLLDLIITELKSHMTC